MPEKEGSVYLECQVLQGPERVQFESREEQAIWTAFRKVQVNNASIRKRRDNQFNPKQPLVA